MDGANLFFDNSSMDTDLRARMRGFERRPIVYERRSADRTRKPISDIAPTSKASLRPAPMSALQSVETLTASEPAPPIAFYSEPVDNFEPPVSPDFSSLGASSAVAEIAQRDIYTVIAEKFSLGMERLIELKENALNIVDHYRLKSVNISRRKLALGIIIAVAASGAFGLSSHLRKSPQQPNNLQAVQLSAATAPVGMQAINEYSVPADQPKLIDITYLGVHSRVKALPVKAGQLQTAFNINDTAWDNASAKPGDAGTTVISGQISSGDSKGIFNNLANLRVGDIVQITKGDNSKLRYQVMKVAPYDTSIVNMSEVANPIDASRSCLNLVSIAGANYATAPGYNQRVIVYTEQI